MHILCSLAPRPRPAFCTASDRKLGGAWERGYILCAPPSKKRSDEKMTNFLSLFPKCGNEIVRSLIKQMWHKMFLASHKSTHWSKKFDSAHKTVFPCERVGLGMGLQKSIFCKTVDCVWFVQNVRTRTWNGTLSSSVQQLKRLQLHPVK